MKESCKIKMSLLKALELGFQILSLPLYFVNKFFKLWVNFT